MIRSLLTSLGPDLNEVKPDEPNKFRFHLVYKPETGLAIGRNYTATNIDEALRLFRESYPKEEIIALYNTDYMRADHKY